MKIIGKILVALGIIWGVFTTTMDTTVAVGYNSYSRVNNIGLMDAKRNHFMGAGLSLLIGVLLFGFGVISSKSENGSEIPTKIINTTPNLNSFEGNEDIASPSYQLFLTRKFNIERNNTLEKFTIGDKVFNTLEEALIESHTIHSKQRPLGNVNPEAVKLALSAAIKEDESANTIVIGIVITFIAIIGVVAFVLFLKSN